MSEQTGVALRAALAHFTAGRLPEAAASLRQVLQADPSHAHALHLLGAIVMQEGDHAGAVDLIERAIAAAPGIAMFHNHLGIGLKALGRLDEAIAEYRRALTLDAGNADYHNNLGTALYAAGDSGAAIASLERAIALRPGYFEAHYNLGNVLKDAGELSPAVASYDRALALKPGHPDALVNRGMTLLLDGIAPGGWEGYEYRSDQLAAAGAGQDAPLAPRWRGEPLEGRTVLLHAEQGFGDTLQFVRYARLVAARGARVVVEVQPELHALLDGMTGVDRVLARGSPRPAHDLQCPLPSLPLAFGTRLDSIPGTMPYVGAERGLVEEWRARLAAPAGEAVRVGLAWAGSPTHVNDRNRSLRVPQLRELAGVPAIHWVSLQKGAAADGIRDFPARSLSAPGAALRDFADTAAVIANLDLVIAVDTSVAHLAGAMGKAVWVLLPHAPDWRWLLDREDSPWYPQARLFRQPQAGDWAGVVARVREELARLPRLS